MTAVPPPAGEAPGALTRGDLAQVFFRSFFFQSLWSFQRMQNVGWLFSLWPVFRRLHDDPAQRAVSAEAHAGYFNTHPYTADIIMGVVAGLEEQRARGKAVPHEAIMAAKRAMSGPLSALGETVFWATLRPLLLTGAALAGVLWSRGAWWVTPLLYLTGFNILHVGVRAVGLREGYRRGLDVAAFLVQWPFQVWAARASWLGLGLAAGGLAALVLKGPDVLTGACLSAACLAALRRGRPPMTLLLFAAAAGFIQGAWRR